MTACDSGSENQQQPPNPVQQFAEAQQVDTLFYNGGIDRFCSNFVINQCRTNCSCEKFNLFLMTGGGDADAAYLLARYLQDSYKKFTIIIPGPCKSAGTLIALGAHEIVMGVQGELGPVDAQMAKKDEYSDRESALVQQTAIDYITTQAYSSWKTSITDILTRDFPNSSFKTASKIAVEMTVGLYKPVMAQIDPSALAESARALAIAWDYGQRLIGYSKNSEFAKIVKLCQAYNHHGFVIDRKEAKTLFNEGVVRKPTEEEEKLTTSFGNYAYYIQPQDPTKMPLMVFGWGGKKNEGVQADGKPCAGGPKENAEPGAKRQGGPEGETGEELADVPEPGEKQPATTRKSKPKKRSIK
jgi:hypothetical protein